MSKKFKVQIESDVADGTAPIIVDSTTLVSNLNADLLDGEQGSYYAPKNSPAFTGTPTAPTQTAGNNTTSIATTAFVAAATASAGGGGATISDTAPGSPTSGDLWYDSSSGRTFVYYNDGNTSQWVEVGTASTDPTGNYDAGMSNTVYGGVTGIDGGGST